MITQLLIVITGALAIWLTQQPNDAIKKYACIVGLIGQPFWFYSAIAAEQWGIFLLTCFYTYAWYIGLKNGWLNNTPKAKT